MKQYKWLQSSAVLSSESDHSLGRNGEEVMVERTVSICSENQSEAFFSAEEELSGAQAQAGLALSASRSSSLRHSLGIYRSDHNPIPK